MWTEGAPHRQASSGMGARVASGASGAAKGDVVDVGERVGPSSIGSRGGQGFPVGDTYASCSDPSMVAA